MNKEQFEKYLFNPNSLPHASMAELKQVVDEYPFFQTAHMLYLKSLHLNQSISYGRQLKQAACHVNDRSILFRLIKGLHEVSAPQLNQSATAQGSAPYKFGTNSAIEEKELFTKADLTQETAIPADTELEKDDKVAESTTKENLNDLILRRLKEIEEQNTKPVNNTDLHKTEDLSAAQKTPAFTVDDTDVNSFAIDETVAIETDKTKKGEDEDLLGFDYTIDAPEIETPKPQAKGTRSGKFTPQSVEYIHNLEQQINAREKDYFEVENPNEKPGANFKLIDAFLEKSPRITQKRPVHTEPIEDISESSVQEAEIMTETLAKIYLRQKQYEKAKKIYETLSLKYPQKSIYFADQISKIKDLINNT